MENFCDENRLLFIPSVTVGMSYRYAAWGDPTSPRIDRNPSSFGERLSFEIR